jgi:hypothetical protein
VEKWLHRKRLQYRRLQKLQLKAVPQLAEIQ